MITLPSALTPVVEKLEGWWTAAVGHLPDLAVALVVLLVGAGIASVVRKGARRGLHRVSDNRQIAGLLSRGAWLVVIGVSLFLALGVLGLDKTVTSLLAGAGVVGLAIGFAAQTMAANAMSGVIISVKRPFRIGEWIETDSATGCVQQVDLSVTTLRTTDGRLVRVANRDLLDATLWNLSRSGMRRVDVAVGCAYGDDVDHALQVTRDALSELAPEGHDVEVFATGFGGSSVDLVARVWTPWSSPKDTFTLQSKMIVRIKRAWDDAGITIPFPIRTLDFGVVGGRALSEEPLRIAELPAGLGTGPEEEEDAGDAEEEAA